MALKLDFLVVPTYNSLTIGIADASIYVEDPPEVVAPTLEICVPGYDTVVSIPFAVNDFNVLTSATLGITDVEDPTQPLPDGIYIFRYSVTPAYENFIEKTIMRVEQLQEKFDEAFMKLDMMQFDRAIKEQQKVTLTTINFFVQGAIAAANNCATDQAVKLYQKADKMLDRFINQDGCCNNNYITNFN